MQARVRGVVVAIVMLVWPAAFAHGQGQAIDGIIEGIVTKAAVQLGVAAPSPGTAMRRPLDYYEEAALIWLEADMKLREISANYTLPPNLAARWLHSRSVSINVAARNLGYPWSRYPGIDPESNNAVANTGGGNSELTAQPPLRYIISRVNIQF